MRIPISLLEKRMFSMNATDVLALMERIAITQLMRSRTSSDVSLVRRQRKPEMLQLTCHRWEATVATRRRQGEMDHRQGEMDHRRTAEI
jgi:hypothetical protein